MVNIVASFRFGLLGLSYFSHMNRTRTYFYSNWASLDIFSPLATRSCARTPKQLLPSAPVGPHCHLTNITSSHVLLLHIGSDSIYNWEGSSLVLVLHPLSIFIGKVLWQKPFLQTVMPFSWQSLSRLVSAADIFALFSFF